MALDDDLTAKIIETLGSIEGVETCQEDVDDFTKLKSPVILLDVGDVGLGDKSGTGQFPAELRFTAEIIISNTQPHARRIARHLAIEIMRVVDENFFGFSEDVELPEKIHAEPDPFKLMDRGGRHSPYEVWQVEWRQTVHLGEDVWQAGDVVPQDIKFSTVPEVGTDYEASYQPAENSSKE